MAQLFEEREIDCRGLLCPQPVIHTKEALEALGRGRLTVLVDNEAARSNVSRFLASRGLNPDIKEEGGGVYRLTLEQATSSEAPASGEPASGESGGFRADSYLCRPSGAGVVGVIDSDTMGRGDNELGRILMRAFIKTLPSIDPLPQALYFYNSGVRLTAGNQLDHGLLEPLMLLGRRGVAIYSCGACLDFFGLKDELRVGEVTNMYEIITAMSQAPAVIRP